ncbi:hypothetical protein BDV96DRAFT_309854 [Lophiotrema nucula]|uniref:Indole-diterpene biosynthesis protein-like protein PaxU n=1 Tax=Lophiotrema nucula TaxID=690887 RepID=A0A6A5YL57_9PLEO|nr:hypothetical protein BDV96DRAFT_309854 [Lophiotrema nucula]
MATSRITPDAAVAQPLADFQKIGHNTFIYTPESYTRSSSLVLFFSWMGAAPKHIAKYSVAYRKLFPNARILLVRCELPDMFHSRAQYRKLQAAALNVVAEHVKGSVEQGGDVLVHSSSNGGGKQVIEFSKSWKEMYGEPLSMRTQILDSSPGIGDWQKSHAAISLSLPRNLFFKLFGSFLVHSFLLITFVINTLLRRENDILVLRRELNDTTLFSTKAPRVYLYSKADAMVGHEEVEEHADEAAGEGWDVQKVRFENSPHAGHVREDEGKYWGAVMDAWNKGPKG